MATFVLIPGAGGAGRIYWRDVVDELERRGHTAVPVEIQGDDSRLGLPEYAAITDDAIGEHREVVLVAQSMGGFTAPMIAKRDRVSRIVFLNAMIPLPGETPGDWFDATGAETAGRAANEAAGRPADLSIEDLFLHDIPAQKVTELIDGAREPAGTPFGQPCTFATWPEVPMHVLVGADDRLFPAQFQVRLARERLGLEADIMPGGHLVARSRPAEVARRLVDYLAEGKEAGGARPGSAGLRTNGDTSTDGPAVPFDFGDAADRVRRVAEGVRDDQLDGDTPCADWTVRQLASHICGLTVAFTLTARHASPGDPPAAPPALATDWRERLSADLDGLVAAWREPDAWVGMAEAGGITMPSADLAVVALDELVLHGWDLARSTGQDYMPTETDVAICRGMADAMSQPGEEAGREGLYGPIVITGEDATSWETLLGLTGRDPEWSPER